VCWLFFIYGNYVPAARMTPALPSAGASIQEDRDVILAFFAMQKHSKKQDAPFSRPFGATENDAQKLHALWLLPMIGVRNTAHEVLCVGKGKRLP
ncbi:MAG: hypothetical protein MR033_00160, partial [Clostridiales bacterium]|nr:hypothetical protein [Clostridiales bacterium]